MTIPHELLIWELEVPVVSIGVDLEFNIWELEVPVVEIDESWTQTVRSRASMF